MKKSRTLRPAAAVESPTMRRLPLVELLVDTEAELFELAVRSGLQVLETMLEEDRTAICGPRYAHQVGRTASRAGTVASEVVLGGRKVGVRRPRVRAAGQEVPLPTFQAMAQTDPLRRRTVEQLLLGVSTRRYARRGAPRVHCSVHGVGLQVHPARSVRCQSTQTSDREVPTAAQITRIIRVVVISLLPTAEPTAFDSRQFSRDGPGVGSTERRP